MTFASSRNARLAIFILIISYLLSSLILPSSISVKMLRHGLQPLVIYYFISLIYYYSSIISYAICRRRSARETDLSKLRQGYLFFSEVEKVSFARSKTILMYVCNAILLYFDINHRDFSTPFNETR